MDVGLPWQEPDLPDLITSPYAAWVCDTFEVAYDQVRRHSRQRQNVRKDFMIEELSDGCSRWVIGFCVITPLQRSANWIPLGLVRILLCPW